jgi:hypothetical protein
MRCQQVTHVVGAQPSSLSTALGQLPQRNQPALADTVANHHSRKVRATLEWHAHRAAPVSSSVGLKRLIVVHLHHSITVRSNHGAGLGHHNVRRNATQHPSDLRGWSSTIIPPDGAWPTSSANSTIAAVFQNEMGAKTMVRCCGAAHAVRVLGSASGQTFPSAPAPS